MADALPLNTDAFTSFITSVMQSAANGAGATTDPTSAWYVQPTPMMASQHHGWLWTKNGIAAAIAQIPPLELAQCGLMLTTGESDPDCSQLDADHGLTTALGECMTWARAFAGAGVLIHVAGDDWSQPWVPAPGQTIRLRVAHAPLLRPAYTTRRDWLPDPDLPEIWHEFTPPWGIRHYELTAGTWTPGIVGPIHWTRVLPMIGHPIPDGVGIPTLSGWPGISIFDHIWSQLCGDEALSAAARRVSDRMALWVFTFAQLAVKQAGPDAPGLQGLLDLLSDRIRTSGMMTVPEGSSLAAVGLPLDGFDKLDDVARRRLCAVTFISAYKLWGDSATGFGDDTAAREHERNTLRSWWDRDWRRNVERVIPGLSIASSGRAPASLTVDVGGWLQKVSIEEETAIGAVEGVVRDLVGGGVLTREEGRKKLAAEGWDLTEVAANTTETIASDVKPIALTSTDIAGIVTVDEARASQSLPPLGSPDGGLTVSQYQAKNAATVAAAAAAAAGEVAPTPTTAPIETDADPIESPDEIPDDTSAAVFAEQMTAHGFGSCEHGKKNRCLLCRIERVRAVEAGPDGQPVYAVKWRAIGASTAPNEPVTTDAHEGTAYLWLPVPEVERVAALQRAAAAVVPLEGYEPGDPMPSTYHATVLYLGPCTQQGAKAVQARAPLATGGPMALVPRRVLCLPAGPDGRSPVVIELRDLGIGALRARLFRSCAEQVNAEQHEPYVAHVTLGFARITTELSAQLEAIPVPEDLGEAAELRLTYDGRDTVWPL